MLLLFFLPVLVLLSWGLSFYLDKQRIRNHLRQRGDEPLSITWKIFGKGWISEAGENGGGNRIYKLAFYDRYGNKKQAWCKTAMWSGVFLTDELIIEKAKIEGREITDAEKIALLEDEVKRLRSQDV